MRTARAPGLEYSTDQHTHWNSAVQACTIAKDDMHAAVRTIMRTTVTRNNIHEHDFTLCSDSDGESKLLKDGTFKHIPHRPGIRYMYRTASVSAILLHTLACLTVS
jgi:hypothetical protein